MIRLRSNTKIVQFQNFSQISKLKPKSNSTKNPNLFQHLVISHHFPSSQFFELSHHFPSFQHSPFLSSFPAYTQQSFFLQSNPSLIPSSLSSSTFYCCSINVDPRELQENNRLARKRVVLGEIQNVSSSLIFSGMRKSNKRKLDDVKEGEDCRKELEDKKEEKGSDSEIDEEAKSNNPRMCGAYATDIYNYLRTMEMEAKRRPLPDYLEKVQTDVNSNMRGILVDWLVGVVEKYKLQSDALFLAVSHIDRFLSTKVIDRERLQLLGVSSMLISSKYEKMKPNLVENLCDVTDNSCTKEDVEKMEVDVLKSLNYEIGNPTAKTFLRQYTRKALEVKNTGYDYEMQLEFLGCYLAELSLLDYECVKFLPSLVAASAIFLSRYTLQPDEHPWNSALQRHSGHKAADLKECVDILHELQKGRRGGALLESREKYEPRKFKSVSKLDWQSKIPDSFFEDNKD